MQAAVMEGGIQTSAAPMKRSKAQKNSAARKRKKAAAAAAATSAAGGASPSASVAAANVAVAAAAAAVRAARATPAPPSPAAVASTQPETGASPSPLAIRAAPAPRQAQGKKRRRVNKDKVQATAAAAAARLGAPPGAGPAYTHDHRNGAEGATTTGESQRRSAAASGDSVIKTRQPSPLVSRPTAAATAATAVVAGISPSPPPAVARTDSTAAGTPGSAEREQKKKRQKNKNKKKKKRKLDATKNPSQDSSSGSSSVGASAERRVPGGEKEAPPVPGKRRHENQPPTSPGNPSTDGGRGRGEGREKEKEQEKEEQEARLSKILESARKKHRQEIGKGRPLLGWDIAALAGFVFGELATLPLPNNGKGWGQGHVGGGGQMQAQAPAQLVALSKGGLGGDGGEGQEEDDGAAVEAAVDAVTATAEEEHAGQVTMSQFEALIRKEANGFTARRRATCMLRLAAEEEQAGNIEGAEAGCAACLAACPGFSSGHLKMAQILRARGVSEQRAIRDVEFHLRLALASASKAGTGPEGEEIARTAAERLALLLCQEGRNKEAAKILKRQGFRYRLSTNVLCYPLPRTGPSPTAESEPAEWDPAKKTPPAEKTRGREGKKIRGGNAGWGRGGMGAAEGGAGVEGGESSEFVSALDGALPSAMLGHLQEAFGSRSRFWSEHGYNSETGTPGYFSYIHSLEGPHQTSIEQVIGRVRTLAERSFPAVKEAKFVEWWAHRRPHSSGHQMHFDSDNEGRGGVRNPIVSVVVYVTGDVGGPTLVTTQRLTSKRLADRGWIVHPRVNRVCMFDGGVLHGVIPGRGIPQSPPLAPPGDAAAHEENGGIGGGNGVGGGGGDSEGGGVGPEGVGSDQSGVINPAGKEDARRDEAARGGDGRGNGGSTCKLNKLNKLNGVDGGGGSGGGGGGDDGANPKPIEEREGMRVTWMVAFWRDIQSRPPAPLPTAKTQREASSRPPSGAGAAQPFPQMPHPGGGKKTQASASAGRVAEPTWPALFRKKPVGWGCCVPTGGSGGPADGMVTPVTPVPVPRVWEDVDGAENRRVGGAVSRLKRLPEYDLCFQGF